MYVYYVAKQRKLLVHFSACMCLEIKHLCPCLTYRIHAVLAVKGSIQSIYEDEHPFQTPRNC